MTRTKFQLNPGFIPQKQLFVSKGHLLYMGAVKSEPKK